ncbi:MAG: hypothetical protein AVDCRST_MAG75-2303 [uncultured Propionibacteriaceae bacterium]|uniref:Pyruvoyl-dependent arginine decarboxylase AaxB n=1 Tax=uncultured Propionibacteriaceae bacterium TaxID=257457 RepID=A0A6J4P1H5_9ACTN|nr:MAG: hypothetical protein AVDCRST_MAG75-2303 [uncultured Propionibacteriaceae bacterium]
MVALLKGKTLPTQTPNARQIATNGHVEHNRYDNALSIRVSSGTGFGRTRLSAFDAALRAGGVADFNLIRLSSVIPPGSEVREVTPGNQLQGGHGDALFCVYADAYASTPGEQAWAGIAWSQRDDGSGAGLFVEHHGSTELLVRHDLATSLADLSGGRGGLYHPAGSVVTSATCVDHPVAAVVVAAYRCTSWEL